MKLAVPIFLSLSLGCATVCYSQVIVNSVADAASYAPRVAPGGLASIFGANLAASTMQAPTTPLPTSLGGTSVTIQGTPVPLVYVSQTQINFQVPSGLAAGQASLIVRAAGGSSSAFSFSVMSQAPAIFQYGVNHAVAQNGDSDHSLNSASTPAASGSVITVYLTGQGPVDNAVKDGSATPVSPISMAKATVTATIGPQNAPVQFLGLTPGFVGLAQANIQVPNLPNGDYPLVIIVGGFVSTSAVISVSGTGTPFASPLSFIATASFANSGVSNVALLGNTAYVCGTNRIVMIDVTDPTQPSVIGNFGAGDLNGNGTQCVINSVVTNPYLVDIVGPLSNPVRFAVYDLTNPRSPNALGVTGTTYPYIVSLSFSGSFGFASTSFFTFNLGTKAIAAQSGDFLVFDFTTPAHPQFISILQPSSLQPGSGNQSLKPSSAVVNPSFAYIASTTASGARTVGTGVLDVINIASPFAPSALNQVAAAPSAILLSFDVSGNTLLAAGNTTANRNPGNPDFDFTGNLTLTTMDVSTTSNPVVITSFNTGLQVNGSFHTAAFTNGFFAVVSNAPATDNSGPASLGIVDARNPQSPVLFPIQTEFGFSGILPTSSGYLLAGTVHGLNIYRLPQ